MIHTFINAAASVFIITSYVLCKFTGHENSEVQKKVNELLSCKNLLDVITSTHVTIEEHINFDHLIPFFNKYRIFTRNEMECLMNKLIPSTEKVNNLITLWIPGKHEDGLRNFVKALDEAQEHSGHITIIEHLYNTAFPTKTTS